MKRQRMIPLSFIVLAAFALGACGDDAEGSADEPAPVETTADEPADAPAEEPASEPLTVTMQDFHYGDLPESVPVGTELAVTNASQGELHEFVAFRLPDGDERSADEIMEGDLDSLLGGSMPTMVLLAPPSSSDQIVAVGEPVFTEAGRYLVLCAIPTGADAEAYLNAAAGSDGPPEVDGGPPHFMNGMYTVIEVVA
ncbi:MAG: hypothetical protein R2697_07340 [Ilumatobacteraceae bacterium]